MKSTSFTTWPTHQTCVVIVTTAAPTGLGLNPTTKRQAAAKLCNFGLNKARLDVRKPARNPECKTGGGGQEQVRDGAG